MQRKPMPVSLALQLYPPNGSNKRQSYQLKGCKVHEMKGKPFELTIYHIRIVIVPILLFIAIAEFCSRASPASTQPDGCNDTLKVCKEYQIGKFFAVMYLVVEVHLLVYLSKGTMITGPRPQNHDGSGGMASRISQPTESLEAFTPPNPQTQECPTPPGDSALPSPPATPTRTRGRPLLTPIDCRPSTVNRQQKKPPAMPLSPESPTWVAKARASQGYAQTAQHFELNAEGGTHTSSMFLGEVSGLGLYLDASETPQEARNDVNNLVAPRKGPKPVASEPDDRPSSRLDYEDPSNPAVVSPDSWCRRGSPSSFRTNPIGMTRDSIAFIQVNRSMRGRIQKPEGRPHYCGGYSDVWKCRVWFYEATNSHSNEVAVKVLRPFGLNGCSDAEAFERMIERLSREVIPCSAIDHPNIAPLFGLTITPIISLISPWYGQGNVRTYLQHHRGADRLRLLHEVSSGLDHLHSQTPEVIHGDIKPENVLIGTKGEAVIIDFGLATVMEKDRFYGTSHRQGGSVRWMAPELLMSETRTRSRTSDVYSFGSLASEVMTGVPPHASLEDSQIYFAVCNPNDPKYPLEDQNKYPQLRGAIGDMILRCWSRRPEGRPSMLELRQRLAGLQN